MRRPDSDFVWSETLGVYVCVKCGQPAVVTSTVTMCLGECDERSFDPADESDCAAEGYTRFGAAA